MEYGTPSTVPGAPTDVIVTPGNGQLSVTFAPTSTGGSEITSYECTATPATGSPVILSGTGSPIHITGLTNGTTYSVVVRAVNKNGNSNPSTAVSGTPGIIPDAPVLFGILSGNGELSVGFCPVLNANPPIIRYESTAYPTTGGGSPVIKTGTASPIVITGLTNGTPYLVVVRSVNVYTESIPSNSLYGTPGTASAPRISQIIPGIGQLYIAFVPPTSDGGFAITSYQCIATPTTGWPVILSRTISPILFTGLSNITYQVQIRAVNQYGLGTISNIVEGTPVTVPGAPHITEITPGNGTLSVAFTTPSTGGSPILYYQYSLANPPSNWVNAGTTSPIQITGLSNGTTYSVTIRAVNVYGDGTISNTVSATTIVSLPPAPTITEINPDMSGQLIVYFNISSPTPITGYKYSTDNGSTFPGVVGFISPIPIPASYNVTNQVIIRAYNSSGDGAISNMVEAIYGAPSAPTITDIEPGDTFLMIKFTKPVFDGFAAIAQYQYSVNGGSYNTISPPDPLQIFLSGLSNGTPYSVVIRAVSYVAVGANSNTVIGIPGAPSAPIITSITSRNISLDIYYSPPLHDGGFPLLKNFRVRVDGTWIYFGYPYLIPYPISITGLTNGRNYPIIIQASNQLDYYGPDSNTVNGTPSTTPSAPVITSIVPGNGQLFVYFTQGSDGGSAIIRYDCTAETATQTQARSGGTTSPFIFTGLTNGTTYSVTMRADNGYNGPYSTPVSGTPGLPTAPTITGITPGNGILFVDFIPPSEDGGFLITRYNCTAESIGPGIFQSGGTTSPFVMTGLTNGTSYSVVIQAVNSVGAGSGSTPASGTPISAPSLPSAPYISEITPGNQQLLVSYCPPISNGGFPITSYQYSTNNGGSFTVVGSITSPFTIFGLTNGIHYDVIIYAVNSYGSGDYSNMVVGTPNA